MTARSYRDQIAEEQRIWRRRTNAAAQQIEAGYCTACGERLNPATPTSVRCAACVAAKRRAMRRERVLPSELQANRLDTSIH